jgi:quercetin dioxygenase-like cupin family protein
MRCGVASRHWANPAQSGSSPNAPLPAGAESWNITLFMKPIQIPPNGGKQINVLGIPMEIRIHGRDTNGVVSAVESHDVPGGGPPPHIHQREDETFQILEGEYEWTVGGKTFIAQKGAMIFAPRGIPHMYRYLGKTPGRLMCVITPAGFEGFFEEIGSLSPEQQQDIPRVIELGRKYGLEFPPPP